MKLLWYLKQLLPLTYRTRYSIVNEPRNYEEQHFCVWRQWFGYCFDIDDVVVA